MQARGLFKFYSWYFTQIHSLYIRVLCARFKHKLNSFIRNSTLFRSHHVIRTFSTFYRNLWSAYTAVTGAVLYTKSNFNLLLVSINIKPAIARLCVCVVYACLAVGIFVIQNQYRSKLEFNLFSVCNRTIYGDIGRTYSLRVPPPQWNRLPFLCHITFTASGHEQGDIVQVSASLFFITIKLLHVYPNNNS